VLATNLTAVNIFRLARPGVAGAQSRCTGSSTGYSHVHRHRKSGYFCRAGLPVCGVVLWLYPRYHDHRGIDFRLHVTLPLHRVTMALHMRNVKNIFIGRIVFASVIFRAFACNAGRRPLKVPENLVVSPVVNSSTDYMMMDRKFSTDLPDRPTTARVLIYLTIGQQAPGLPPTAERDAP
jgi:hypothetical protein